MKRFCVMVFAVVLTGPVCAASLADLLEQAWQRQPATAGADAQRQLFATREEQARALLAGPPAVSMRYTADQAGQQLGLQRWESELSLPLWWPGQRNGRQQAAQAEAQAWQAAARQQRWVLAGQLRELAAQYARQRWDVDTAELHVRTLQRLADDSARRVQAGELAPVELNETRLALSAAQRSLLQAHEALQQSRDAIFRLTGTRLEHPLPAEVCAEEPDVDAHPALQADQLALAAVRARRAQNRSDGGSTPELTLGWAQEKDQRGDAANSLFTVGVRLPLGPDPAIRQSQLELQAAEASAVAQLEQTRQQLASEINTARRQLDSARQAVALADEDVRLTRQNRDWLARAHALGEQGLPALLRAENALATAVAEQGRARLELDHARARLNQALGVMP